MTDHVLEPAAQRIADATSQPPYLYDLGPDGARKVLDDIQAAPIDKLDVDETWITVPAARRRRVGADRQAGRCRRAPPPDGAVRARRRLGPPGAVDEVDSHPGADDLRPAQRRAPRLHGAQPPACHGGDDERHRPGGPRPAGRRRPPLSHASAHRARAGSAGRRGVRGRTPARTDGDDRRRPMPSWKHRARIGTPEVTSGRTRRPIRVVITHGRGPYATASELADSVRRLGVLELGRRRGTTIADIRCSTCGRRLVRPTPRRARHRQPRLAGPRVRRRRRVLGVARRAPACTPAWPAGRWRPSCTASTACKDDREPGGSQGRAPSPDFAARLADRRISG